MSAWKLILLEPAKTVFSQIGQFFVNVLLFIFILLVGWIISKAVKTLVSKFLATLKVNELSERIGLDNLLAKGGIAYSLSELIGVIFYWLGILVTFVIAINAIGLTVAAELLNRIVLYVPNIIAALFILILGIFVATLLRNIVQTASSNAGLNQAKLLAKVVETVVVIFTVIITLEQLNIGANVIELAVGIVLASLGLALGLSFGLGCKDIAAKFIADFIEKIKTKK